MVVWDSVVYDEDGVRNEGEIIEFLYDGLALTMKLDEAETAYHNLVSILSHINEEPSDFANEYWDELAKFLTKHGRL